ncbi:MAG: hypothetical protein IE931_13775 [Sphingobacteriales bacterium]|nr:hypothetical protein [Sphingobacteriales bacterium]
MKKLLFLLSFLGISFISLNTKAQGQKDTLTLKAYIFCELIGSSNINTRTKVIVDFGLDHPNRKEKRLIDEQTGKIKIFNSMIDALNFMSLKGWEFVQAYVTLDGKDSITHWLLKKKASPQDN